MTIPIQSFLPGLINAAGKVGSYFLSRGEIARQNRYNSPAEQVKRLREAGLPYAAAKDFQNTQQNIADTSGIGEAGEAIGGYVKTAQDYKQLKLLSESIDKIMTETDLLGNELKLSNEDVQYLVDEGYVRDGDMISWRRHNKEIETAMNELGLSMRKNEDAIKAVEKQVQEATTQVQIDTAKAALANLNMSISLKSQAHRNIESEKASANALYDMMKEGGLNIFEALSLQVLQGFSARGGTSGIMIGN